MPHWIEAIKGKNISVPLPCPSFGSGGVTISTKVDGGTNANGDFIGTVVGKDKLSISISYSYLNPEQFRTFLDIFDRDNGGKFCNVFRVYDPRRSGYADLEMYVSDRSAAPYSIGADGNPTGWVGVSATLTEL